MPRDPIIGTNHFCHKGNLGNLYPFNKGNVLLFGYARIALLAGMAKLGLKEDDIVLVPNYICNVVLAPMHYLNLRVQFYDVDRELRPDWSSVKKNMCEKAKALLVVNYFGFPNDMDQARAICDHYHLHLIEDNAHGFLSSNGCRPLGTYGDISIFSFRKMICVPNGAALVFNNVDSLPENHSYSCYAAKGGRSILRFFARSGLSTLECFFGFKRHTAPLAKDLCDNPHQDQYEEYEITKYLGFMPQVSKYLMERIDFGRHAAERREMYKQWVAFFQNCDDCYSDEIEILWPILPEGVVPHVFPLLAKNRADLIRSYWQQGIQCFPWPFLPIRSRESYFSKRLVCLPVSPYFKITDFLGKR